MFMTGWHRGVNAVSLKWLENTDHWQFDLCGKKSHSFLGTEGCGVCDLWGMWLRRTQCTVWRGVGWGGCGGGAVERDSCVFHSGSSCKHVSVPMCSHAVPPWIYSIRHAPAWWHYTLSVTTRSFHLLASWLSQAKAILLFITALYVGVLENQAKNKNRGDILEVWC